MPDHLRPTGIELGTNRSAGFGAIRLRIPGPPARPGERPDFSYLNLSTGGATGRPDPTADVDGSIALSVGLIRVLDEDHRAVGPWNPGLEVPHLLLGLQHMLKVRVLDERLFRMQRQGRISFYVTSTGEEAVSVAGAMALDPSDMLFPSYRNQGLHIARGRGVSDLMCQCLSNTRDMCKGRQMPVFYHWGLGNIFSISGNLATQVPQAVGWAMAAAIRGQGRLAAAWLGEGATAEGDFHNALTFAGVFRAPVIMSVVNNQWAISTFQSVATGARSFAVRGPAYGIAGLRVDGNDFLAVHAVTAWAAERARSGHGATLIEAVTYRAGAHSTSDDPSRYRAKDEASAWPLGDPIERLKQHLIGLGAWSEANHESLRRELEAEVAAAWKESVAAGTLSDGPRLSTDLLFEDVYKELPAELARQREQLRAELG